MITSYFMIKQKAVQPMFTYIQKNINIYPNATFILCVNN